MPTARHAATVILTRAAALGGLEVLLVKRQESLSFMGGLFVFPGGKLDPDDCTPEVLRHLPAGFANPLRPVPGLQLTPLEAGGLYVAAVRELFEEVGVLLVRDSDGHPIDLGARQSLNWLTRARQGIIDGHDRFADILDRERLTLDVAALLYWAHWLTPSAETRRFDTRFFLAECPASQSPKLELREASDMVWLTPERALDSYAAGHLPLSPPTFRNLQEMSGYSHPDALLVSARCRRIDVLLPKVIPGEKRTLLMPWDPAYAAAPGDGIDVGNLGYGPSRMVLDSGVWRSLDAND